MAGILEGIRIVDLSQGLAGALVTLLFAEQGADVIKVEPPGGDPTREIEAGFFIWNRSKRGVTLDLGSAADRARLRQLLERADVLVESFTAAESSRYELDYNQLKSPFPHLIHCKISGYGMDHPWRDRPAIEALVAARTGLYHHQAGIRRDGPTFMYCPYASYGASFTAALGICGALRARLHTGRGQFVDTSLMDGVAFFTNMLWQWSEMPAPEFNYFIDRTVPYPVWLYECSDGLWLHHMRTDKGNIFALAKVLGITLPPDAMWMTDAERWKFNDKVIAAFQTRPREEWIKRLREVDIPVEAVMPAESAFAREQTRVNGMVHVQSDPERGAVTQIGIPIRFSRTSGAIRGPAPRPGQHNDEVMREAGTHAARAAASDGGRGAPQSPLSARRYHGAGLRRVSGGSIRADGAGGPGRPRHQNRTAARGSDADSGAVSAVHGLSAREAGPRHGPEASRGTQNLLQAGRPCRRGASQPASRRRRAAEDRLSETLRAIKPDLIYTHSAAYGTHGPDALMGGYDQLFAAMCGMEHMGGGDGNAPIWNRLGTVDAGGATLSAIATVMAVYHRDRTGDGTVRRRLAAQRGPVVQLRRVCS